MKGAPEVLKEMLIDAPDNYDKVYLENARRGARVLALGYRQLGHLSSQELRNYPREKLEKDLKFAGFVIISCPLKQDSKAVISEILNASHHVTMITGDNPLTACHVGKTLRMTKKENTLILRKEGDSWIWESVDQTKVVALNTESKSTSLLIKENDLCITGDALNYLKHNETKYLHRILPHVKIFARFAPKQKEYVVVTLKALGFCPLMCGDGTNDVGALKHADVGVAILSNAPERLPEVKKIKEKVVENKIMAVDSKRNLTGSSRDEPTPVNRFNNRNNRRLNELNATQMNLQKLMKELEEQDQAQVVKLGDASIAAPFTSKLSSIQCSTYCYIIK